MFAREPFVCGLLLVLTMVGRAGEVDKELEKLQGEWVAVFHEVSGVPFTAGEFARVEMAIKGDKWILKTANSNFYRISLNPTAAPKEIDRSCSDGPFAGKVFLGIYKLEEDMLTLCTNSGGKKRPQRFSTREDTEFKLYIFKRVKP
jgi:uncharacterized protein (TIGR03067 family)